MDENYEMVEDRKGGKNTSCIEKYLTRNEYLKCCCRDTTNDNVVKIVRQLIGRML